MAAFSAPWPPAAFFFARLDAAFFVFLLLDRLRDRPLPAALRFPRRVPPLASAALDFVARFFAAFERDLDRDLDFLCPVVAALFVVLVFTREWLLFRDADRERPAADLCPLRFAAWEPPPLALDLDDLAFAGLFAAPAALFRISAFWLLVLDRDLERDLARAERLSKAPLLAFFAGLLALVSAITELLLLFLEWDPERDVARAARLPPAMLGGTSALLQPVSDGEAGAAQVRAAGGTDGGAWSCARGVRSRAHVLRRRR